MAAVGDKRKLEIVMPNEAPRQAPKQAPQFTEVKENFQRLMDTVAVNKIELMRNCEAIGRNVKLTFEENEGDKTKRKVVCRGKMAVYMNEISKLLGGSVPTKITEMFKTDIAEEIVACIKHLLDCLENEKHANFSSTLYLGLRAWIKIL